MSHEKKARKNQSLRGILAGIIAVAGIATSTSAWAVTSPELTTLALVEYSDGTVILQDATGNNFYAQTFAANGCSAVSTDAVKAWLSEGQAAVLSGKTVKIYFTTPGAVNCLSALDLNKN
jgi:hypothetical protein